MRNFTLKLKDFYPILGQEGRDPDVEVYLPTNLMEADRQEPDRPCMVVCPGGGYGFVSRREAEPMALNFLPEGYNVFVLTYSVEPHHFPVQLREVAAVMDLIHKNAADWRCDTSRVAIMGFSAGGHLAAHYSNCYDCEEVRQVFPDSKGVNASVLCYPVITGELSQTHPDSIRNVAGNKNPTAQEQAFFSCEKHVSAKTPPAFLWHTAEDDLVPVVNSLRYATALADHGVNFELHIYPKGFHGLATADGLTCDALEGAAVRTHDWIGEAKKWLAMTLA